MKGRHIALAVFAASAIGLAEGLYTPRTVAPWDPAQPACTLAQYDDMELPVREAINRLAGYPEHDFPRDVIVIDLPTGRIGWRVVADLSPNCQGEAARMHEDDVLLQD